jgi:ABC-type transport system involved in Fe-S cluster assembly fused permease/ATPase subunit
MPASLPLTVGVLSGMMWLPMSWILQHWIGLVHGGLRTVLVVVAWYMFPAHRFVVVPFVIVALYVFAIVVLESRWRAVHARAPRAAPTN